MQRRLPESPSGARALWVAHQVVADSYLQTVENAAIPGHDQFISIQFLFFRACRFLRAYVESFPCNALLLEGSRRVRSEGATSGCQRGINRAKSLQES